MERIMGEIWYKVRFIQAQNQKNDKNIVLTKDNPNNRFKGEDAVDSFMYDQYIS